MRRQQDDDVVFWQGFFRPFRMKAVRSLLVGNDTQCFTTEQYRQAYMTCNPLPEREKILLCIPREELFTAAGARKHLTALFDVVREVQSNLWTMVEENP